MDSNNANRSTAAANANSVSTTYNNNVIHENMAESVTNNANAAVSANGIITPPDFQNADTTVTQPQQPMNAATVQPQQPMNAATVQPQQPMNTATVQPQQPMNATTVQPQQPMNATTVQPQQPMNTTTVQPQQPMNTTVVQPQQPMNAAMQTASAQIAGNTIIPTDTIMNTDTASSATYQETVPSGVIDSRSFTRLTDDWKYEREAVETRTENTQKIQQLLPEAQPLIYDDTPRGLFRVFLRLLAGIIAFIVVAIPVCLYFKMEYISTLQAALGIMPSATMVFIFWKLNKQISRSECMWLIFINIVLSLFLFWGCMACSMQKLYPVLTFSEAWKSVGYMPQTGEGMRIFLLQFLLTAVGSIFTGCGSAICYHKGYV